MIKEELLKFDGTRLFQDRQAFTVNYELSDLEAALYASVAKYVVEGDEWGREPGGQTQGHHRLWTMY